MINLQCIKKYKGVIIMGYYMDAANISLDEYANMLKTRYLLPGQMILRENLESIFNILKSSGINNMQDLKAALKTKKKAETFAASLDIPTNYIIVLRRQLLSHFPPARKLAHYPTLRENEKIALSNIGILTSEQIFPFLINKKLRDDLAQKTNSSNERILHIAKLIDVTRLRYVSPIFATLIVHSKYDCVAKIAQASADEMYDELRTTNEGNKFFKGNLGKNDIIFLIEDTQNVSLDMKF